MSFELIKISDVSDKMCIDRLTKQPITLLCETSFSEEELHLEENKLMYVFVNKSFDKTHYLGFCRINAEHNYVDRFEIFSEYRLRGYGRIFVNLIKSTYVITDYYQILDDAIGFWTKMYGNNHNLFLTMLEKVINKKETFEEFCKRLNYESYDQAYNIFQSILTNYKQNIVL